jgi:hypothetical protein
MKDGKRPARHREPARDRAHGAQLTGPPDPGDWLLTPIPLAVLCLGIAAIAVRFAGRRFEWVGAAVELTAGLSIVAVLPDETERLLENARIHWMWLAAVALLGIAGGSAARISAPVKSSPERLRFSARGCAANGRRHVVRVGGESGLAARQIAGGADDYRIEIDEPESVCNMFSRRTIVAQYPPAD